MKRDYIYIFIIVILLIIGSCSIRRCQHIDNQYNNNIVAPNDTIHYYKTKNKQLAARTLGYETDIKTLELLNKDLYDEIKNLKIKKPTTGAHFSGVITNTVHDTTFIFKSEAVSERTSEFNFNNQYRILEGKISANQDEINMKIERDEIMFDYTLALDNKNNIYVTSSNPYVQYNEITGFTLPKTKQKRWSIGPSIQYGYDPINNTHGLQVGISLNYGLIKF